MRKYLIILLITCSFGPLASLAQNRSISGIITGENGPLQGVTVVEKDVQGNGVATNTDGRFLLNLKGRGQVIIVSLVGYLTQEINIAGRTTITVNLKDDVKGMEDVVVIGYGRKTKITNAGAVSSVSGAEIRKNPSSSIQNTLAGRLPGFTTQQRSGQPGADAAQFFIRGVNSYTGSNTPLVIVDDVEYNLSRVGQLDPNEIESISILKDASTTAIYGIRGANGVLVITTRRGVTGRPQINVRSELGLSQNIFKPKILGSYDVAVLTNEAYANSGIPLLYSPRDLQLYKDGSDPFGHPDVDWYETLFNKTSKQIRNNIDFSGGTESVKYFVSLGQLWQNGLLKDFSKASEVNNNFYYKRYNFRSNLDIQATKNLKVRLDITGIFDERNQPNTNSPNGNGLFGELMSYGYLRPNAYPVYNPNGTYGWNRDIITLNAVGRIATQGYTRNYNNELNIVFRPEQKLDFITKGLSAYGLISYASSQSSTRGLARSNINFLSYYFNSLDSTYTPSNTNLFRIPQFNLTGGGNNVVKKTNIQGGLNYQRSFGVHNVSALALYNRVSDINGVVVPVNTKGITGRISYDYNRRYLLEAVAAYNGTDQFAEGRRYGWFPAVSAGWNVSEEKFFRKTLPVFDLFKIRGSYGLVGLDGNLGVYAYDQVYAGSTGYNFGLTSTPTNGIIEGTLGNNTITWEKERKMNIGVDLTLFKNHLSITADYFDNNRSDILTTRQSVPLLIGIGLPPKNIGKTNNRGYDGEITYRNATKNFSYSARGTFSFAKNKIVFQDEANPRFPWLARTGQPIGQPFGYIFDGYYASDAELANPKTPKPTTPVFPGDIRYRDLNGDAIIDAFDQRPIGKPNLPQTTLGLNLSVAYKNISFNMFLVSAMDYTLQLNGEAIATFNSNFQPIHLGRWTPQTAATATFPVLRFPSSVTSNPQANTSQSQSTFWQISDAKYLRLKTAEIGYDLPQSWLKAINVKSARIYANGYNLLTFTNVTKRFQADPEVNSNGIIRDYQNQRIFNFGANVSF